MLRLPLEHMRSHLPRQPRVLDRRYGNSVATNCFLLTFEYIANVGTL